MSFKKYVQIDMKILIILNVSNYKFVVNVNSKKKRIYTLIRNFLTTVVQLKG